MFTLNKKIISILFLLSVFPLAAEDITVLFLKNGTIVQGEVLDENNRRLFLKTEQGILKIEPRDVIGRESHANEGDLTYLFEKVDYVRDHMEHLSGRMKLWSDTLDLNLEQIFDMVHNLESIQYEFELDFLRLNSTLKTKSKALAELEKIVEKSNLHQNTLTNTLGQAIDTLTHLSDNVFTLENKVSTHDNQNTILTGTVTNLIDDLRDLRRSAQDNRNHIDILTGSLAELIRTVDGMGEKLAKNDSLYHVTESSITDISNTLTDLKNHIELQQSEIMISMEKYFSNSNQKLESLNHDLSRANKTLSSEVIQLEETVKTIDKRLLKIETELSKP